MAASSKGNAVDLIHALMVMLPVNCSDAVLPRFTKAVVPLNVSALPNLPAVVHVAPLSVPVLLFPEASAVVVPVPSLKAYPPTRPATGSALNAEAVGALTSAPGSVELARCAATLGEAASL